jgi:prevent-host-death family protein
MSQDPETISVTDLRIATREILENAHFRGRRYIVARAGQPMVAIVGVEEYERLVANLADRRATDAEPKARLASPLIFA